MSYLGQEIGKLGFGLMRLPTKGDEIDIEQTKQMVDAFLKKGFTYFDTAYGYGNGKSEEAAKTALVDRYPRESFKLATKLPAWAGANTAEEAREMFWTSLKRTGAGYFDYYLLHNLGAGRTEAFDKYDIWSFLQQQKTEGRIKHLGFSIHAKADYLDEILTKHPEMEFVQLQINYADWESEVIQSRKCYEVARKHNKPVIIMEPVKGGVLAKLPESVAKVFTDASPNASQSSWALRFAASLEGIVTVLSGMSSMEQMTENLEIFSDLKPLDSEEQAVVKKAQETLASIESITCTSCQYCVKDCPQKIAIPGIFSAMNFNLIYGDLERAKGSYSFATANAGKASACIACGACEGVCPQSIPIIEELAKCARVMEA